MSKLIGALLTLCLVSAAPAWPEQLVGYPIELSDHTKTTDRFMSVQLRGAVALRGDTDLAELSGLAWDEDQGILYAISDQGRLLHLAPVFQGGRLINVNLIRSYPLRASDGEPLRGNGRDAEGLSLIRGNNGIQNDSQLLISFEQHHRIVRYSTQGEWIRQQPMPIPLTRSPHKLVGNRGLEAITLHPELGFITGPERPRDGGPNLLVNTAGRIWRYDPITPKGALVAMEALPDGGLLILERAYRSLFQPWVISLGKISREQMLREQFPILTPLARFDSSAGWYTQNFEGLTRYRGQQFFMVSDDGNKPWAQTQLLYFELLESAAE